MHRLVLTFDDGPHLEHTPRILDTLAKYDVPALFFVLGERLQVPGALEIVRRAAREGHLIGNHGFNHLNLTEVSPEEARSQILQTHHLISPFEPRRRLFRPPYGAANKTVKAIARELGYRTVFWNASSRDWLAENRASAWVDTALEEISAQHVAICLCHDTADIAEYLPRFLERLRQLSSHKFVDYYRRRDLKGLMEAVGDRTRDRLKWIALRAQASK